MQKYLGKLPDQNLYYKIPKEPQQIFSCLPQNKAQKAPTSSIALVWHN